MDNKKLQQYQQMNPHLITNGMQQGKIPLQHTLTTEYRATSSPIFHNQTHYNSTDNAYSTMMTPQQQLRYQQAVMAGAGRVVPELESLHSKSSSGYTVQQQPTSSPYHGEQIYQGGDRNYHQNQMKLALNHSSSANIYQQQYQQIQEARIQQQLHTQNEAIMNQQRTFALRQQLNPPIPSAHLHMQSASSSMSMLSQQHSSHKNVPPSSLPLPTHFQPANGPIKVSSSMDPQNSIYGSTESSRHFGNQLSQAQIYGHTTRSHHQPIYQPGHQQAQQQQMLKSPSEQTPIIQQNHPGFVVNQACQTQISDVQEKPKSDTESPSHAPLDRKKSGGGTMALKSPVTKRPLTAPVTMSGWLYKQGSDGLKVWRKRWFVLADYCLFYYKGPEEEKTLGSILLPSYHVSPCTPDDKIYRKFAFKCEHQNMRTYWLAAETAESMAQWIKVLVAATLMQGGNESDQTSQPSVSSLNHSGENSDSGIHTYQSHQSKLNVPVHINGPATPASDNGGPQPLYANAPPKPRRANDGGYSSPSPEHSIERYDQNYEQQNIQSHADPNLSRRSNVKSPNPMVSENIYGVRANVKSPTELIQRMQQISIQNGLTNNMPEPFSYEDELRLHQQHLKMQQDEAKNFDGDLYRLQNELKDQFGEGISGNQYNYMTDDGRLSDVYGQTQPQQQYAKYGGNNKYPSDYDDIYNAQMQQKQKNLTTYQRPISPTTYGSAKFMPPGRSATQLEISRHQKQSDQQLPVSMRSKQTSQIPRPHSADFLEFEARHPETAFTANERTRAPRPKSSLDINRSPDSLYYSEASYAEKMRQSALYLQKPTAAGPKDQNIYGRHTYSGGRIPPESDYDNQNLISYGDNSAARNRLQQRVQPKNVNQLSQQEQFIRSASARLPRNGSGDENFNKEGERKREESMKRLLEWKQRMLQSPLTRKGPANQVAEHQSRLIQKVTPDGKIPIQRSRSEMNANLIGHNSYSSDDDVSLNNNLKYGGRIDGMQSLKNNPFLSAASMSSQNVDTFGRQEFYDTQPGYSQEMERRSNSQFSLNRIGSQRDLDIIERERETSAAIRNLDVSAGELLSRTHEELVLLLIQLRRQSSNTARAIEQCCTDIHEVQNRIRLSDSQTRTDNINRLDALKHHLVTLEKQYEKSKPLINLVDNMVKLGSLYRGGTNDRVHPDGTVTLDRMEFNQRMQEKRLLQDEQKHWDRLSPNHTELQSKVNQLYHLDQLLQQESGTLQSLQRDKEDLERALGGLRQRLPLTDNARKQQHALECELSRVHQLLAENSKKLEQTVAGNARLEQELLVLRQKLQASKGLRGSQSAFSNQGTSDSLQYSAGNTAILESELRRVQQLVGDMQRQRQELSQAVRQLTENSNSLYQQIRPRKDDDSKRRLDTSGWVETDLDSMVSRNSAANHIGDVNPFKKDNSMLQSNSHFEDPRHYKSNSDVNMVSVLTEIEPHYTGYEQKKDQYELESDDMMESSGFSNLTNQEKQEIKTVRIVKRESERRQRDRERCNPPTTMSNSNLDEVLEEESDDIMRSYGMRNSTLSYNEAFDDYGLSKADNRMTDQTKITFADSSMQPIKYTDYFNSITSAGSYNGLSQTTYTPYMTANQNKNPFLTGYMDEKSSPYLPMGSLRHKTESIQSLTKTIGEPPVFHSEAAREIITEITGAVADGNHGKVPSAQKHRRAVPKEKRRHFTAPTNNINDVADQNGETNSDVSPKTNGYRARDDLDMEVALRPRINEPDVVRSAMGNRDKISENTIDRLLGAPSKILIPERYIPEQTPELSPEEKKRRQEKVEAIKKMLSEAPINANDSTNLPPSQLTAEKKQREHLLQLNQILAQQVMQMSKIVAEKAMATLPSKVSELSNTGDCDNDVNSPDSPLPIYQQRDNFFT